MRSALIIFVFLGAIFAPNSYGYPREEITFSSRQTRNWLLMKQFVVEVTSSQNGRLASITSDQTRSSIAYRFGQADPQVGLKDDSTVFEKIKNIRTYNEVFGEIGFPQIATLTKINGSLYGLILTTVADLEPQAIAYIETEDPKLAEEYYESLRHRTGTSGNFGSKLGGVYPPKLYDSAVLVKLDGELPEILKIYNIVKSPLLGYDNTMHIYDTIYEYAYADLVRMTNENSCDQALIGSQAKTPGRSHL